jgi:hypothetical protein
VFRHDIWDDSHNTPERSDRFIDFWNNGDPKSDLILSKWAWLEANFNKFVGKETHTVTTAFILYFIIVTQNFQALLLYIYKLWCLFCCSFHISPTYSWRRNSFLGCNLSRCLWSMMYCLYLRAVYIKSYNSEKFIKINICLWLPRFNSIITSEISTQVPIKVKTRVRTVVAFHLFTEHGQNTWLAAFYPKASIYFSTSTVSNPQWLPSG